MPPGSSQVIPSRAEFDAGHETVVLRQGGKALAIYNVRDLEAAAEWDEETGISQREINYE
jgi:hypothetical protein